MVGITAAGTYLPVYRLNRDEIASVWKGRSTEGTKAVAGYDEDTVTMAAAAASECLKNAGAGAEGLSLATTTAPYREKQSAAIVAAVADLPAESHTADFTGSLRASAIALKSAVDAVRAGSAANVLVTAADCRLGAAKGMLEQALGDGAAALMIGSEGVIAEVEGSYSVFNDFTDFWRHEGDTYLRSAEQRFIDDVGFIPTMQAAIIGLLEKNNMTLKDFSKIVFYASDLRQHAGLARRMKLNKEQVQAPLYDKIGNTGTAAAPLMLIAALETAAAGQRILFAAYGDGCDAFALRVTDNISNIKEKPTWPANWTVKSPLATVIT